MYTCVYIYIHIYIYIYIYTSAHSMLAGRFHSKAS